MKDEGVGLICLQIRVAQCSVPSNKYHLKLSPQSRLVYDDSEIFYLCLELMSSLGWLRV